MRSFKLLHLSDLHIDANENENDKLIRLGIKNDISSVMNKYNLTIDSIAITGDIINKGNAKSFELAEETIKGIVEVTGVNRDNIILVPGNHDIPRDNMSKVFVTNIEEDSLLLDQYYDLDWKYIEPRFKFYNEFVNKITPNNYLNLKNGFGFKLVNINNLFIHFNCFNTAWASFSNEDYNNLYLGKWQMELIRKQKNYYEKCDLSITLSHHPLKWLKANEQEMVDDFIGNTKKINTDVLLHGHVHNAKLNVITNPNKSICELTTGIGYPEKEQRIAGQSKISGCRYSIYSFNIDEKIVECICRISNNHGAFVPDISLYSNNTDGLYTLYWNDSNINLETASTSDEVELDFVPLAAGWSGRSDELNILNDDNYKVILISGVGGQGKTALASEYFRRETRATTSKYDIGIWVDCRELQDTIHIKLLQLLEVLSGGIEKVTLYKDEKISDTISRLYNHLKNKKLLIVFDNVDAYVNLDTERLVAELKDLIDMVLTREHNSQIILTCRVPIYDNRANFKTIKLEGLKEDEGIELFRNRNVTLNTDEELTSCKKIINITKGHPWWLGLIIGQITASNISLKEFLHLNSTSILSESGNDQLKNYFNEIWKKLGKNRIEMMGHDVIRYLVEASKPLTTDEISSLIKGSTYSKMNQVLGVLKKLNLIETHEDVTTKKTLYHVHPLVREYIHNNYSVDKQKVYVTNILKLFINFQFINAIFNQKEEVVENIKGYSNEKDLIYSIDVCLNSRNYSEAFILMLNCYKTLRDKGLHKDFISLGCRILNEIDWDKEQIVKVKRKAEFLADLIDVLNISDNEYKEKSDYLILKYKLSVELSTIPYSGYLNVVAFSEWKNGRFDNALEYVKEYKKMAEKHSDLWNFHDITYTNALALRDRGDIIKALEIFKQMEENSSTVGNIARCLQKKGDYNESINQLRLSLQLLQKDDDLTANTNRGYAYLWIAEVFKKQGRVIDAKVFLYLCEKIWKEYAPGLLSLSSDISTQLVSTKVENIDAIAQEKLHDFLQGQ
jgi:tetratricopeptide (TPR) repeat protein/predicted phosphodiesterase